MDEKQRKQVNFSFGYLLLALLGLSLFQMLFFEPASVNQSEASYSQFRQDLAAGRIDTVTLSEDRITYTCCIENGATPDRVNDTNVRSDDGGLFNWWTQATQADTTEAPLMYSVVATDDPDLIADLVAAEVTFRVEPPVNNSLVTLLGWMLPLLPLALIWYFMFRRMGAASANVLSIGKSKAREISGELIDINFDDVGGVDEVEVELKEIIDFLKEPDRFTVIGAKLPKGVLMVGPPGSGKTLLAKATAGEAGVPFFLLNGSSFVEMFVGVGASRVRDLFVQAKGRAPFIDEIDAIGQSRASAGSIMTNDEREQTLNQLLAEMDGFEPNQGVVIMAATNRPEVLDKALLRPGRFDRQIQVTLPTEPGRRQILDIHTEDVKLAGDVDLDRIAQITPGFSGADLANIVNEAALLAVRHGGAVVTMNDFDLAIERVVAGLQRKMPLRADVRRKVAYHEGGHALVAQLLPTADQVHKVSIIPTAKGALGYTLQMPEEDDYLLGEQELRERMVVMLGGRAAELLIIKEASTGAANDLEMASSLARRMVTEFGMSDKLGPMRYVTDAGMGYLGVQSRLRDEISPETATLIDQEMRQLIDDAQEQALDLLRANIDALHEIAGVLQEKEVINGEEIERIASRASIGTNGSNKIMMPVYGLRGLVNGRK